MENKDKQEILNNLMKPKSIFGAAVKGHSPVPKGDGRQLIVGKDIKLTGDIDVCESLVVEGELTAKLSGARFLDIVSGGKFKGEAVVEEAHISGGFSGKLAVTGTLFVYDGGLIDGEIEYTALVVEKGGQLKGKLTPTKE